MPCRVPAIACAVLAGVAVLAATVRAGAAGAAPPAPSAVLISANLGATYRPAPTGAPLVRCALLSRQAPGARCTEGLWRLGPSAVAVRYRAQALVVYELVVSTPSAAAAQALEHSADRSQGPWKLPAFGAVGGATWALGDVVAPPSRGAHYSDWWWFDRGSDFVVLDFVIVPNPVSLWFDQALRDQAVVAVDRQTYDEQGLGLGAIERPDASPLLTGAELGGVYGMVAEQAPLARCPLVTGAMAGYVCLERAWQMKAADVPKDGRREAVALYELVVRAPDAAAAQALDNAIAQTGSRPWTMPGYSAVNGGMWQIADQAQPGISALHSATDDWWQGVRGNDFMILDLVIDTTSAAEAFAETIHDEGEAVLSENALAARAVPVPSGRQRPRPASPQR